jgi:hypothetical protein
MAKEAESEVWILLAKYLCDEASAEECIQAEVLLNQDNNLRLYFQKIQTVFLMKEYAQQGEPKESFSRLNDRIKGTK